MLLREVIVRTASVEESLVRVMVSTEVLLISRIKFPLFSRAPMEVLVIESGEREREPEFISRVPTIEEPEARVREELILVVPLPETALAKEPERLRVPELEIEPPRLEAEEVRVPELVTLPEILLLLLKEPEVILTLPVIPELLLKVPSETETLAEIPEPLLLKVPEEETED